MRRWNGLTILFHIAGWGLFLTLPFLLRQNPPDISRAPNFPPSGRFNPLYFSLITNVLILPFFYLNLYVLFPKYISAKKYGTFIAVQVIILLIIPLAKREILQLFFPELERNRPTGLYRDFFFVFSYLFITLIAFSYGMFRENMQKERIQKEREHETLKSELQFLRWQVNPHFLFNALNNIVALARLKSEKLEPILIKLSTLMRYMLYEADETKISINKEVEYLQSYIDLQSLRTGKNVVIKTNLLTVIDKPYTIEPMLLIPFIENAFKHGIGLNERPMISIDMEMNGSVLLFVIRNTYTQTLAKSNMETNGIGLLNVRRRLELIYKDQFTLDIETAGLFTVTLKIDIG